MRHLRGDVERVRIDTPRGLLGRKQMPCAAPAQSPRDARARARVLGIPADIRIAAHRDSQALRVNRKWLAGLSNLQRPDLPVPNSRVQPSWHAAAEALASDRKSVV